MPVRRPVIGVLLASGILLAILLSTAFFEKAEAQSAYHTVKRGSLLVSVVEGGTLEAVNEISIRSEVDGSARIIKLVPEGTYVSRGDLLVQLDSSALEDEINQQEIAVEKARLALIQAKETLAIQRSTTNSDISAARLNLEFAQSDLTKYVDGEYPQLLLSARMEITNVLEQLEVSKDRLGWSEKLYTKGFETKSKVDTDRLAYNQQLMRLSQANENLRLLEEFDYPKLLRQYQAALQEAERELDRVQHQAVSRIAQYEADVLTQQRTLELSQAKLEKLKGQFKATTILAPQPGLVVYAGSSSRFSNESMIEEGATVRNRQEIVKLPDVSQMKVLIKVHESHVNQIREGQTAYVVLDSMPDKRFRAVVKKVGLLPDTQSRWGNPNLKVYATEILVTDPLPDVKPGVSARAEIIVTNMQDVIAVPIQSVSTLKGRQVCYVAKGSGIEPVPVEVGMFNTKFIEIASGLSEGDQVLLSPPLNPNPADLAGGIISQGEMLSTNPPAEAAITAQSASSPQSGGSSGPEDAGRRGPSSGLGDAAERPERLMNSPALESREGAGRQEGRSEIGGRAPREGQGEGGRPGGGRFNREEMLKQFDTNADGELDETERAAMRERFGGRQRSAPSGQP